MRLLGAPAPNTEEGTICGHAMAAPATAALFKKSLRLTVTARLLRLLFIVSSLCALPVFLKTI
jgi:hypothetical protein